MAETVAAAWGMALAAILLIGVAPPARAQLPAGYPMPVRLPVPVSFVEGAPGIYANPAALAFGPAVETDMIWSRDPSMNGTDSTLLFKLWNLGLGIDYVRSGGLNLDRTTLARAWRLGSHTSVGLSYQWVEGGENIRGLGVIGRIRPGLLLGLYASDLNQPDSRDLRLTSGVTIDLLNGRLLLSAEGSFYTDRLRGIDYGDDYAPSFHLATRPISGLSLRASATEDEFSLGMSVALGRVTAGGMRVARRDGGSDAARLTWLRYGATSYGSFVRKPRRWIHIRLSELPPEEEVFLFGFIPIEEETLTDLLLLLDDIRRDPKIEGVMLELDGSRGGWASLQEIRDGLTAIRESGKGIIAYGENLGMSDLYLAALADSIFVPPSGGVNLTGLAFEIPFFAGVFEKLGVRAEFVRIDEYKTAPEAYMRTEPSEASLEMQNWLMDSLAGQYRRSLATGRETSLATVTRWFDHGPFTASEAERAGLVDGTVYPGDLFGQSEGRRAGRRIQSASEYRAELALDRPWIPPLRPKIAVIHVGGAIVSGESGNDLLQGTLAGAETVARKLRAARRDPRVAAIVLRVNSPGGSALASDLIWHEVRQSASSQSGKPLVVSMANVAASGGYYISSAADAIVARSGTITGSIGIYGGKFDLSGLYEKIGYTVYRIERGRFAGGFSETRGFTEEERIRLREVLQQGYDQFLDRVGQGRGMGYDEIDSIGRGRVWTGEQAVELGLVDRLGGLLVAVDEAKRRADLEGRRVELVPYSGRSYSLASASVGRFVGNLLSGLIGTTPVTRTEIPAALRPFLQAIVHWEVLSRLSDTVQFYLLESLTIPQPE
jgi:protease-4